MSQAVRLKVADQMGPYEAPPQLRLQRALHLEDLAEVRTCLERAVEQAPGERRLLGHAVGDVTANETGMGQREADSLDRSL